MDQKFTAPGTRQELQERLAEALTSSTDLRVLVAFLRDDLAYAPDNPSIINSVLRKAEFDTWRDLMTAVRWDADWPIDFDAEEVRELSRKLLTNMEKPNVRFRPIADIRQKPQTSLMTRRAIITSVLTVVLAAYAAWWTRGFLAVDACLDAGGRWQNTSGYCQTAINPIEIAEEYARKQGPAGAIPSGLERQWWVSDHGDIWIVELGSQGHVGGGMRMAILKSNGRVLGHDFTQ